MAIQNENYITITGWMVTDLKLKGNELMIYAMIYGFSQAPSQVYKGGLQYLADWTNSTKQGVIKNLKSLVEKGYIEKKEIITNNVKYCEYYATKFNGVLNKVEWGIKQSLTGGIKQSLTNNTSLDNNNDNNNDNKECVKKSNTFHKPTLNEITQYCLERDNNIDPERFINYYDANGWRVGKNPMKDWRAAIRTWERGDNSTYKPSAAEEPVKETVAAVIAEEDHTAELERLKEARKLRRIENEK